MHIYFRGDDLQKLRLLSGVVLLAFAGTHFLNHALGLIGLEVMHKAQVWRTAVTRSVPGSLVLLIALLTHMGLGLYKTAMRNTWRMPPWEFAQIASGLLIPFLLLPHIVNTRMAHTVFGVEDIYLYELKRLWPLSAWQQSALLLLVWAHGCIGLHHWLRLDEGYRRLRPLLGAVAIAVPLLALAGFVVAGRTTADIMSDAESMAVLKARSHWPNEATDAALAQWRTLARLAFASAAVAVLLTPFWRSRRDRRASGAVRITYSGGPTVTIARGRTLLEASRAAGVRHASVCGGRARCSTCRVRIKQGRESLPPPEGAEAVTLQAIGAPEDVRLACQLRPTSDLTVALVSAPRTPGPVQLEFDEVKEVVAAHARARALGHLVEKVCAEPSDLTAWLHKQLGGQLALPSANLAHESLRGGRVDYLGERAVAVAVFALGSEDVSVFVIPGQGFSSYMVRATRHGYRVLGWSDERSRYLAVASAPQVELERLSSSLGGHPAVYAAISET
jgi:adenylate cyclase